MRRMLSAVSLAVAMLVATASAGARPDDRTAVARAASRPGPVTRHQGTGLLRFLGSAAGRPLPRPAGLDPSAAPTAVARALLARHGPAFGVEQHAAELVVASVRTAANGRDVLRFQQVHRGVPVLGGELVVNLDGTGNLLSIGGEALPEPELAVVPTVTPADASAVALRAVANAHGVSPATLRAGAPARWIVDSALWVARDRPRRPLCGVSTSAPLPARSSRSSCWWTRTRAASCSGSTRCGERRTGRSATRRTTRRSCPAYARPRRGRPPERGHGR